MMKWSDWPPKRRVFSFTGKPVRSSVCGRFSLYLGVLKNRDIMQNGQKFYLNNL